ncbi:DUF2140 family protein [Macrococcus capreoli]|uniref:DUF2140 family protein n=1 Tax=Macrococcus capreoli TaxID=2982690 RepID=UPI0021D5FE59|nr:DUF2140 family protein [Macrococcus sp. TMW 2.2395]MCU7556711.1 DUF2140 family protein [Macrococcus sp. TMW 2.2395]
MTNIIKHPIWAILFLILCIANICCLFWLIESLNGQPKHQPSADQTFRLKSNDTLILSEATVKKHIDTKNKDTAILFNNYYIWIKSSSKFMNFDVESTIKTKPVVISPGVLSLEIKSVDIGNLPISKKQALRLVQRYGALPQAVKLDEENERFIYTVGIQKFGDTELLLTKIENHQWYFDVKMKE